MLKSFLKEKNIYIIKIYTYALMELFGSITAETPTIE